MSKLERSGILDLHRVTGETTAENSRSLKEIIELLGVTRCSEHFNESLPFSLNDAAAGFEDELQAAVMGAKRDVDLSITIERSNYYANMIRRANAGETPTSVRTNLEAYLNHNPEGIWENSWVRFPWEMLSPFARKVLDRDLLADKKDPGGGLRTDADRFIFYEYGEKWIRVPISYLIKLSLADVLGSQRNMPATVVQTGHKLLDHFSNDNTSFRKHYA